MLLHHVLRVQNVGCRHQQAEQAEVVAEERDVEREADDGIVGGEVVRPQETLLAQLDGTRHEHEQCHDDGELKQHRQAAAHRADAVLAVKPHDFLLFLHGILLFGILPVDFIYFRLQHAHLGRRHVGLPRGGEYHNLHNQRHQQQHDAHAQSPT